MVRAISPATTSVGDAEIRNSAGGPSAGLLQQRDRRRPPATMNAALSTLTAAITRARRSAPAQACTAENAGTMNRPPAIARPARSDRDAQTRAEAEDRRDAGGEPSPARRPQVAQPRSSENRPSRTAPIRVGNRTMRPGASQAARPEPIAIEIEKMARQTVTTSSTPPRMFFTIGGSSESATAPTSQNQLVTSAPHQAGCRPTGG